MKQQILFLLIIGSLMMNSCTTIKSFSAEKEEVHIPSKITDYRNVSKTDNIFTCAPIVPVVSAMQGGSMIGNFGIFTGINITNTHMRLGTLKVEGLYYFDYHLFDDEFPDTYSHSPPFPFGRLPSTSGKVTYDLPLLRLSRKVKKDEILHVGYSLNRIFYLLTKVDIQYIWNMNLRMGLTNHYIYNTTSAYSFNIYTKGIDQKVNTIKMGIVFSRTANTSLTAELNDPRFKKIYKPSKTMRAEYYIDFDYYLSAKVLPVMMDSAINNGLDYVIVTKHPENEIMKFCKAGIEIGAQGTYFQSKYFILQIAFAVGSGVGYVDKSKSSLYLKTRFQFGFGAVRKGRRYVGY
jgi:hypothetical protein